MNYDNYFININTLAIIKSNNNSTIILENEKIFYLNNKIENILNYNCNLYGSSYRGRIDSSKKILYTTKKLPIVLENRIPLIFFPTNSLENDNCVFINYNNIKSIIKKNKSTVVKFKNDRLVNVGNSYFVIKNQYLKAVTLDKYVTNNNKTFDSYN